MIVTAWNPETEDLETTYLSRVVQAGVTSLTVKNSNRIPANSRVLIGEMGMEQSEIVTVLASPDPSNVQLVNPLKFAHSADEPVYVLRYDEVQFYRSNAADGVYSLIDTRPIDVDNRDMKTEFNDTTGMGSSFYKTKYFNSITGSETDFSDYISAEGYADQTIGLVIQETVKRVKDFNYAILSSDDYLSIATEVNHDISSQSERPHSFTRKSVLLDRIAGQNYLELPKDYFKFFELEYTNRVGSYPQSSMLSPLDLSQFYTGYGVQAASDRVTRIAIDDETNRILLRPTPRTGATDAFRVWYYRKLGSFKNLTDPVITPNTLIYRYKFMAEFYSAKAETDPSFGALSTKYEAKYGNELMKLQRSNRKDVGTPRSFADSARTTSRSQMPRRRFHL